VGFRKRTGSKDPAKNFQSNLVMVQSSCRLEPADRDVKHGGGDVELCINIAGLAVEQGTVVG